MYAFGGTMVSIAPAQGKLRIEHVLAPKFFPVVNLLLSEMIYDQWMLYILISYLSCAFPDLHDLSACSSLPNQRLQLVLALRPSGFSTLKLSLPPQ
jgi:hypothetical protein